MLSAVSDFKEPWMRLSKYLPIRYPAIDIKNKKPQSAEILDKYWPRANSRPRRLDS